MRASSNNHYQKSLPFTAIQIHTNKSSEDDTGYDSLPKQERINSLAALSLSSSDDQFNRIMNLVKSIPSPTDISTIHNTSDIALTVAQRIAQFSKKTETPIRKLNRTRIQPILDSTSDSAESFALSNHLVLVSSYPQQQIPPFSGTLEYIHDNRFDSTTTVDHIKDDIITIELKEQQTNSIGKKFSQRIKNLGESIRLLPANILAIVFISLIGGLIFATIFIIIIL
jgi:hypothetical protein